MIFTLRKNLKAKSLHRSMKRTDVQCQKIEMKYRFQAMSFLSVSFSHQQEKWIVVFLSQGSILTGRKYPTTTKFSSLYRSISDSNHSQNIHRRALTFNKKCFIAIFLKEKGESFLFFFFFATRFSHQTENNRLFCRRENKCGNLGSRSECYVYFKKCTVKFTLFFTFIKMYFIFFTINVNYPRENSLVKTAINHRFLKLPRSSDRTPQHSLNTTVDRVLFHRSSHKPR